MEELNFFQEIELREYLLHKNIEAIYSDRLVKWPINKKKVEIISFESAFLKMKVATKLHQFKHI